MLRELATEKPEDKWRGGNGGTESYFLVSTESLLVGLLPYLLYLLYRWERLRIRVYQ